MRHASSDTLNRARRLHRSPGRIIDLELKLARSSLGTQQGQVSPKQQRETKNSRSRDNLTRTHIEEFPAIRFCSVFIVRLVLFRSPSGEANEETLNRKSILGI